MSNELNKVLEYRSKNQSKFEQELFDFLKIKSVSTDKNFSQEVQRAATWISNQLKEIGMEEVTIHQNKEGHPIVTAEKKSLLNDKNNHLPTVLIYGHFDVQPPDPLDLWDTLPFEPVVKNNRVYARGASDDKGQSLIHIKALESYLKTNTSLPVNIKILFEGEEEIGSKNLFSFIEKHKEVLKADVILISDTPMFAKDTPMITNGVKGIGNLEITLTGPNRDLHSGIYGTTVDNPAQILSNLLAFLKTSEGKINVDGFYDNIQPITKKEAESIEKIPLNIKELEKEVGVKELPFKSKQEIINRIALEPTLDINGITSGYQGEGSKTIVPSKASVKISLRFVPDQDPEKVMQSLKKSIERFVPATIKLKIDYKEQATKGLFIDPESLGIQAASKALEKVYKKVPFFMRSGASLPIVPFASEKLKADVVLMGFGLPEDNLHSPNESFSLEDFERGIETSIYFFNYLEKVYKSNCITIIVYEKENK